MAAGTKKTCIGVIYTGKAWIESTFVTSFYIKSANTESTCTKGAFHTGNISFKDACIATICVRSVVAKDIDTKRSFLEVFVSGMLFLPEIHMAEMLCSIRDMFA